ncbi:Shikimate kinase/gluconokinase [Dillenia turbinata]|uniref:Shikimate kinase/gluconokinase n=1 Tax=Dillenia turbinata TaxID=194707 RepID=A0AAN8UHQ2_9MAGN
MDLMGTCSISSLGNLRFLHPLTKFQLSPRFFCCWFPKSQSLPRSSKLVTFISCSVANDGSVTKAVETDPSLAVKKVAAEISSDLKGTSIFLVGMKCEAKTNLGKLLADSLRYYYFDSDGLVEEAAGGESAAKALKETDEKGFRDSETEVLKQLSSMGRLVVSAGDGAVQSCTNLALLRHGVSIWMDVPLDCIAMEEDLKDGHASAISASGSYSEERMTLVTELYKEMREGYATADATVSLQKIASQLGYDDISAVTTEDVAMEVLNEIQKLTRVKRMMEAAARPF